MHAFHSPHLRLGALALSALALVGCQQEGKREITEKEARKVLQDKFFLVEKSPVTYNDADGLWYVTGTKTLAEGVAWVPDTGGNVDDYIPNPQDRPAFKEAPNRIGYLRRFEAGKQYGPTIEFTAEGTPNKVFYYLDNSMEYRFRFDNAEKNSLKEILELTDGHADGRLSIFHPNGQQFVESAMHTIWDESHPKGGPDFRAGRWQEWAPDGSLLMDVDFNPDNGQMVTIRELAPGFRLYWNYTKDANGQPTKEKMFFEVMLAGINGGYPVQPGSQAAAWLEARAPETPIPDIPLHGTPEREAIEVEEMDAHMPRDKRLQQVPGPGPAPTPEQEAAGLPVPPASPAPEPVATPSAPAVEAPAATAPAPEAPATPAETPAAAPAAAAPAAATN